MQYTIFEISGKQYLVKPGQTIEVDKIETDSKTISFDKVLLVVDNDKVEVGTPYLKKELELEVLGNVKKKKIRVAKYQPKANSRRVKGSRREVTKLKLADSIEAKKSVKKA